MAGGQLKKFAPDAKSGVVLRRWPAPAFSI
jgi:hypothetical protein